MQFSHVVVAVAYTQFTRVVELLKMNIDTELDDDNFFGRLMPYGSALSLSLSLTDFMRDRNFYYSNTVIMLRAIVKSMYGVTDDLIAAF